MQENDLDWVKFEAKDFYSVIIIILFLVVKLPTNLIARIIKLIIFWVEGMCFINVRKKGYLVNFEANELNQVLFLNYF